MSDKSNALNKNIIYTYSIDKMSDTKKRNNLLRQLLDNVTDKELEKLENFRQTITTNSSDKNTYKRRPIPTPRKSVKELVQQYEENIIPLPVQFRDQKPVPAPRTKKQKPVPTKRTILTQTEKALKGYTKSLEVEIRDELDPLQQLDLTERGIKYEFKKQLDNLKRIKFVMTLKVTFEKNNS